MLVEILISILVGIFCGIITGLIPGIHINLISVLILSLSPFLLNYVSPLLLIVIMISMAVTHTFLDFIPSCFLGAPDDDTALSVLPAHKLLLKGRGFEAVKLATIGSLFGLIITILLAPALIFIVPKFYDVLKNFIPFILILAASILIIKERKSRFWATTMFFMAGVFGLGVLNLNLSQPLFPMFSGLFGTSMLFMSLKNKIKIPKQKITKIDVGKKEIGKAITGGFLASCLSGFLPGLGAAQAAILASSLFKKISNNGFIVLVGAINTIVMVISFIALYVIDKARNGTIVAVSKLLESFNLNHLILFLGVSLVVAGIATFLALVLAKEFSIIITKINYKITCILIISLISILVLLFSGVLGLFVLIVATFIGMIPQLKGIGRNHLMGSLILPVILFFLL